MSKRFLSVLLALVLVMGVLPAAGAAATGGTPQFSDMPDNWATEALKSAVKNGLLLGENGKIMPDSPLTRAQMATIIVRAFGATEEGDISAYSDVQSTDWFATSMAKAYKMGILQGYDGKMDPNGNITREQAFAVLARALKLKPATAISRIFEDARDISDWAKGEVYALVDAGYIQGSNDRLNPQASISRAEFAQVMHNIIKQYINQEGVYTQVASGNIMVNAPGVTLKNVNITGDLIIGDGVGDGDVTLDNVTIQGDLIVRGGGVNSIVIVGGAVEGNVIIAKVDGLIRVFAEGGAAVDVIIIDDGKDEVIIEGTVGTIEIRVSDVPVIVRNAAVDRIEVTASGAANVTIDKDAVVSDVVVYPSASGTTLNVKGKINSIETFAANTLVTGTGTVSTVTTKEGADNTSVTTPGTKISNSGATGVTAGGGKEVPINGSATNNSQGTGVITSPGGGGGGGDDGPVYVAVSDISVAPETMVLAQPQPDGIAVTTGTIIATVSPWNATDKTVTWSSDNEEIATVDENGKVTAVAAGTAIITAKAGNKTATTDVTVIAPQDIRVEGNGFVNSSKYKGIFAEINLPGADNEQITSFKIELYNAADELIGSNTLYDATKAHGTGLTSPFVVIPEEGGYTSSSWTTEWVEGEPSYANTPSYALITVVDGNDVSYVAEVKYTGNWRSVWAQDIQVSSTGGFYVVSPEDDNKRVTAEFSFTGADVDSITSIKIELFGEGEVLIGTNTLKPEKLPVSGALTSPFVVIEGKYKSSSWTTEWVEEELRPDNPPIKAVATAVDNNGVSYTAEDNNFNEFSGNGGSWASIWGAIVVGDEAELRAALQSREFDLIILNSDIEISEYVNLDNHEGLVLDGNGKTIITAEDSRNNCGLYLASNGITVKNLTITGASKQGIDSKHGTKDLVIQNVTFKDVGIGFYANPNVEGTIEYCTFEGLGTGIGYGADAKFSIKNNSFINIMNKYLEIFGERSEEELNEILTDNQFDEEVRIEEEPDPIRFDIIK